MTKKYQDIFKQLEINKIIENEHERDFYQQVCSDIVSYLADNGKATFQEIIKYVKGSDRRVLRMLDQLVDLEILNFKHPFFKLAGSKTAPGRLTPDSVRCPRCDSKMINLDGRLKRLTRMMKKICKERAVPSFVFDQRPVNYETSVRRVGYMVLRGDIRGKRIAVLGDDDLTSVALGLAGLAEEIVVFDIDKRVIDYIKKLARKYHLDNLKAKKCDFTQGIPKKYRGYFDLFTTDPTPTVKPFTVFMNAGLKLLKDKPGMVGYASIYSSGMPKDIALQKILTSMNLLITDLIPYWTQYDYIKHTYSENDLRLEKKYAADQSKISFFEHLLRFETTKKSRLIKSNYQLKELIGTATERVLADPDKDPALSRKTTDRGYLEKNIKRLKKEISHG